MPTLPARASHRHGRRAPRRPAPRFRWARRTGLWALGGLTAVAAPLLASGLLARDVHPDRAWWLQLTALAVPPATVAVGALGVGWIAAAAAAPTRARRVGVLVCTGLALVGAERLGLFHAARSLSVDAPSADGPPVLRVLTLNAGEPRPRAALDLGRILDALAPDVVVFQEADVDARLRMPPWARAVAERASTALLRDSTYHRATLDSVATPPSRSPSREDGLDVFTHDPSARTTRVRLDPSDVERSGVYSRTEMAWQGRRVAIYNVHLRSHSGTRPWVHAAPGRSGGWRRALTDFRDDVRRRAREAALVHEVLAAETLPFVVAGDFNSTPDQWAYAQIAQDLVDGVDAGSAFDATYPDARPLVRIDALLASRPARALGTTVGPRGLSDHRAVVTDFALPRLPPSPAN